MAIDPICGMNVKEEKAAGVSEYKEKNITSVPPGVKKSLKRIRNYTSSLMMEKNLKTMMLKSRKILTSK